MNDAHTNDVNNNGAKVSGTQNNTQRDSYERKVLFQTDLFEVISIEWKYQSISKIHNHGWSQCLVLVESGVFENLLDLGVKKEIQILEPGQVLYTPVGAKHEIVCKSETGRTLHVYTPRVSELPDGGKFSVAHIEKLKSSLTLSEPTQINQLRNILLEFKNQSISTYSPYFMNQLFSGILPQTIMAEDFITQTKTTLATFEASSVLSTMEAEVIESLGAQIGWTQGARSGVSVPGGSAANFMSIHCARENRIANVKAKGMSGKVLKIFVSEDAHYSFKKAAAVLGIGVDNIVTVPVSESGQMISDVLEEKILHTVSLNEIPLMVVATAGTTVLGAFDDIASLAMICERHSVWLHVDGAWGGPAIFSKKLKSLVKGIELADSVTFDAHKLFGANLTSSFFLTKHIGILLKANDVSGADYLFHSEDPSLDRGKISWQCGRKADAASFWTIWKSLGTEGLGNFVDQLVGIRDEILPWITSRDRLELVSYPDYLNICVRVLPRHGKKDPEWSKKVREQLKEKDLAFVNYSTNKDGTFLRLILAHPYLKEIHIKQILEWALEVE